MWTHAAGAACIPARPLEREISVWSTDISRRGIDKHSPANTPNQSSPVIRLHSFAAQTQRKMQLCGRCGDRCIQEACGPSRQACGWAPVGCVSDVIRRSRAQRCPTPAQPPCCGARHSGWYMCVCAAGPCRAGLPCGQTMGFGHPIWVHACGMTRAASSRWLPLTRYDACSRGPVAWYLPVHRRLRTVLRAPRTLRRCCPSRAPRTWHAQVIDITSSA